MARPTSSLERSFNHLALSGYPIDDDMFIKDYNENDLTPGSLDVDLAYKPDLMKTVINMGIQEDLSKGVIDEKEAQMRRQRHLKNYNELLAEAGKLKK